MGWSCAHIILRISNDSLWCSVEWEWGEDEEEENFASRTLTRGAMVTVRGGGGDEGVGEGE